MSNQQWTVLGMLLAIAGIEVAFSPLVQGYVSGVKSGVTSGKGAAQIVSGSGTIDPTLVLLWLISAAILLAVTDFAPPVGIGITALILTGVFLANGDKIASWLNNVEAYLTSVRANGPGDRPGAHLPPAQA